MQTQNLTLKQKQQRLGTMAKNHHKTENLLCELANRLLERLDLMKLKPQSILDCGANFSLTTQALQKRYPKAKIIAQNLLLNQLRVSWWRRATPTVCSEYHQLPFQSQRFDLVFANLALPWSADLKKTLAEFKRLLKPEGLLLFSTLGPDTLRELRSSGFSTYNFMDMHDIGDILLQLGLQDPVMDMEHLELRYASIPALFNELKSLGANAQQKKSLQGKKMWQQQMQKYQDNFGARATVEIIYGHAFGAALETRINSSGEVKIPLSAIRKKYETV